MELEAVIQALSSLRESCAVDLYTDSAYVENGVSKWLQVWRNRDWTTNGGQVVRNVDLWKKLDYLFTLHQVQVRRVKGHSGILQNGRCDRLARAAARAVLNRH
jgi:ribonuclease HI